MKYNHGNNFMILKLYGNKNINIYIDGVSNPREVASFFDRKYNEILDDINCQSVFNNDSMEGKK